MSEIDIWRYQIAESDYLAEKNHPILSLEEQERATKFLNEVDRIRYVTVHCFLRNVLSQYLTIEPAAIQFKKGSYGKPFIDLPGDRNPSVTLSPSFVRINSVEVRPTEKPKGHATSFDYAQDDMAGNDKEIQSNSSENAGHPERSRGMWLGQSQPLIHFNLSYRGEYALLAVSRITEPGIDIEQIRHIEDPESFCANYFSEKEREIIRQTNDAERMQMIFTFWAFKEAFIKALGIGFSRDLTEFDLSAFIHQPSNALTFDGDNVWTIQKLSAPKGYEVAIAVRGNDVRLAERML